MHVLPELVDCSRSLMCSQMSKVVFARGFHSCGVWLCLSCPSIGCKCIHIHMESAATVFSSRMKRRVRNAAIVEVVAPLLQELYFGTCSSPLERGTDGTNENCFGFARRVLHQALGLDVEADNQAHRSASHRRMPAWSRVCILRTWCALLYLMRAR